MDSLEFSHFTCKADDSPEAGDKLFFVASMPEGDVPTEFQLFPYGDVEIEGSGLVKVDDDAMDVVIQRFEARGLDMVIDYEHQTEGGEWASPDGTAPAAGWIKKLINKSTQGLWVVVEWTDRARALLASREYRYFSPVFFTAKSDGRLVEVARVGLTNAPKLNRLKPIVTKNNALEGQTTEGSMEFLKVIAKLLGLGDDATQEQVQAALKALQAKASTPAAPVIAKEVLTALDLPETAGASEVVASIHVLNALKQRPDLTAEVASLKRRLSERDRDDLVTAAMKEGKITAAQREWADAYALRDPDGFKLFVAKAPVVVPVEDINTLEDQPDNSGKLDDVTLKVAKMMGNTVEDLKKYGGAAQA